MYLGNLIKNLDKKFHKINISGISFNSSTVKKGYVFFAIKGEKTDGNRYIDDAINNGAKIIISEKNIQRKKNNIIYLKQKNIRKLLSQISFKNLNKFPKKLTAVTGTNGKSSISDFYFQMLSLCKVKAASIGTIGVRTQSQLLDVPNTTLDPIKLSKFFDQLKKKNIDHIILEASSHGLKQNRLDGLLFDIGIFTNLSHDHLDYHKNFKDYLNSKLYLFNNLIKNNGLIITDSTIPQFKDIKKISKQKKLRLLSVFGKNSELELVSHKFDNEYQLLQIKYKKKILNLRLNLIGKIQIKNILMAFLAVIKSGQDLKKIVKIVEKIKPVEGRFEKIGKLKNNSKVILDYAHTPDALKVLLLNIKQQFPSKKISLVFGCGGDRDKKKRSKMGKIASKFCDTIYLTDDNPRSENPNKIRKEIKKGIQNKNISEISSRKLAISKCIQNLNTGDIAIVAGKGHEKTQDYNNRKYFFSDRDEILKFIKRKNISLHNDLRSNILKELSSTFLPNKFIFNKASINSKEINKNDIFFAIKGTKNDGNKFIQDAKKKGASLAVVNKLDHKTPKSKQIKVENTLKFLSKCASIYRENVTSNIIGITGSCGKTTLKEMLAATLKQISKVSYSPKSYNNKYGLPLSLFNLKKHDDFGVFELGMDKKGEIDYLTKILKPDLGIITNISYAHSKNFKSISKIAEAKSEIIENIKPDGKLILNADDDFYDFHKKKALKRNLKVLSFSIKKKNSTIRLNKIKKKNSNYQIFIKYKKKVLFFYTKSNSINFIQNLIATLLVLSNYFDINSLSKKIFLNFKIPEGRGDISKIKVKDKLVNLVDESYNSNPLSLRTALKNYDNLEVKDFKKHVLLGDMLELGKHSIKQHKIIRGFLNNLNISKIHIIGKFIKKTYKGLDQNKKGKLLNDTSEIIDLINDNLSNNDYLMVKGSNATGLNTIVKKLKNESLNVI